MVAAAQSLAIDQVTGEVVRRLQTHGVRPVLLKGPSIARWLYDDGHARPYCDIDLLVGPIDLHDSAQVLSDLGYTLSSRGEFVEWLRHDHGRERELVRGEGARWDRADSPPVDLHCTLPGALAPPERCWTVLSAETHKLSVGGTVVEVLRPVALALHIVLHAVTSGVGNKKALGDLARALGRLPPEEWEQVLEMAKQLDALETFAVGLSLVPGGPVLAQRLGVPPPVSVDPLVYAAGTGRQALPFEHMAAARGLRRKLALAARVTVPTPAFVRVWYPQVCQRGGGLLAGYVYRLWWVIRKAPGGLWAWGRARRSIADGESTSAGSS